MPRRSEFWLVLAVLAVLAGAALLGTATAPRGMSTDPRLSTRLTSPNGARALRTLLERFGVEVGERQRPFFDLDRTRADPGLLLVVAQPISPLTRPEVLALRHWVERGGRLMLAGRTGVERCFDWAIRTIDFSPPATWIPGELGNGVLPAPRPRAVLKRPEAENEDGDLLAGWRCPVLAPKATQSLWDHDGAAAATRLRFASGGEVVLVADGSVIGNRSLRSTDAGVMVLGWILAERPRLVLVDEYHQGFGRSGSLTGAVTAWAWSEPAGWMVVQLALTGLLALGAAAVRFGPAVPKVERRRRSPLEHLDALAAGLERSHAGLVATRLIASGLRRRLGGPPARAGADTIAWLDALRAGAQTPGAREVAQRLRREVSEGATGGDVRDAANAVEDLWQILKGPTRTRS